MNKSIGDRMKEYENVSRIYLSKKTYLICRVDGKSFSSYTKKLKRPFDEGFINDMNETAIYLCKNIMGAKFAYVQSDEISIIFTDKSDNVHTDPWFLNNLQKMTSISSSMATAKFNQLRMMRKCWDGLDVDGCLDRDDLENFKLAEFDARVFQLPSIDEVINYFIWRQQDATRNSISSVAQSLYSPKQLNGISSDLQQEMIFQKGINWNDYPARMKRGGFIFKVPKTITRDDIFIKTITLGVSEVNRTSWENVECPIFSQDKKFLSSKLPQ